MVHIAFEDARAYCEWLNKRIPTEAEWELAGQGRSSIKLDLTTHVNVDGEYNANYFQGSFPRMNLSFDAFKATSPVRSFPPNQLGIYDMIGNVCEWTSAYYHVDYCTNLQLEELPLIPQDLKIRSIRSSLKLLNM